MGRSHGMGTNLYEKPSFESEEIFATLATGCNLSDPGDIECNAALKGGPQNTSI